MKLRHFALLALFIGYSAPMFGQGTSADYERASQLRALTAGKVFRDKVEPHWFGDKFHFWYRNELADDAREFVLVNAKSGDRSLAFDHERLAEQFVLVSRPVLVLTVRVGEKAIELIVAAQPG